MVVSTRTPPRGGRPSKGERELLATRTCVSLAEAARERANKLGLTVSDYLAALIANDVASSREPTQSHVERCLTAPLESRVNESTTDRLRRSQQLTSPPAYERHAGHSRSRSEEK
jgi:hypothetical protein